MSPARLIFSGLFLAVSGYIPEDSDDQRLIGQIFFQQCTTHYVSMSGCQLLECLLRIVGQILLGAKWW
jgi:hypothetical protein